MDHSQHNRNVNFIWSIADDELRDVYVRGKYRDVILPMVVLRRLDCLLEPTVDKVQEEIRFQKKELKLTEFDEVGLRQASGQVFFNTSRFTLKKLLTEPSQLETNFQHYLDSFSANVKEIVQKFAIKQQIETKLNGNVLLGVLEKVTSPEINLSPHDVQNPRGESMPGLTNLGMGYVFEELIRRFNEENNEEAGEHFTPREVIKLMTHLVFLPVKPRIGKGVFLIYDPACGSGGMLTEAEAFITDPEGEIHSKGQIELYGREINAETYAICKSDMMIKGKNPENIKGGSNELSTLAVDVFQHLRFDFMLSNPPYGKSWKSDQDAVLQGRDIIDPRFAVGVPRSNDGQLLFLLEMIHKMKATPGGSRIASIHNGSALFTGDAGSGESEIRRHILENDLLEAIVQLPNNLFYNTGITTYVWLLSNRKAAARKGKVQLIDASAMFRKLRKSLGQKNCEFSSENIAEITRLYLEFKETPVSKIFDIADFGYWKITVERPLRLASQFTQERIEALRWLPGLEEESRWCHHRFGDECYKNLKPREKAIGLWLEEEGIELSAAEKKKLFDPALWRRQRELMQVGEALLPRFKGRLSKDFNKFRKDVDAALKAQGVKLAAGDRKRLLDAVSWRDEKAREVVKGVRDNGTTEYEPDPELRDNENVPLKEEIQAYFEREVRPFVQDAWINEEKTIKGYEITFYKEFTNTEKQRSLEGIRREILELEAETEGMLKKLMSAL